MPTLFARFANTVPSAIRTKLETLLSSWKKKAADGLTVSEFVDFAYEFVEEAMKIVDGLSSDAAKKALVLEAAGLLFDYFAPVILIALPWYLKFLAFFFRAGAKEQFLAAITLLIETIYQAKFARPRITPYDQV